ncbi:MAG: putative hydro-lyase [Sneathiellaceae bacterium]
MTADGAVQAARQARAAIRAGRAAPTTGLAPGVEQGNLVILPADWAEDFAAFCAANPRPCPVLARGRAGDPALPELGADIDLRTDLPGYRIFRDGTVVEEPGDIAAWWRDDLVPFVIGCSFSFESALLAAGLPIRHIALDRNVAMYTTVLDTVPAGRFSGPLVVSMRPFAEALVPEVRRITAALPRSHGGPIHVGDPAALGIADLGRPDFGDPCPLEAGEVPVFWACGVTPQRALEQARPPLAITHRPGMMLITDLPLPAVPRAA